MSSNTNTNKTSDNNWLGFSLSPHNLPETSPSNPTTFFNYQNIYYGGVDGGLYSAFPIMPLKSDGSLCLMDSITKSQGIVTSTTPKLENFFGGVTMGTSDLDSSTMYYNQTYTNIQTQQQQQQQQHYQDFSNIYSSLQQQHDEPKISLDSTNNLYLPTIGEAAWVSNNYHSNDLQSLNLSMSPACSQTSSCVTISQQQQQQQHMTPVTETSLVMDTKKRGCDKLVQQKKIVHRKSLDTFGQRTSQYRGVTRHRWTGRYEAHLWDNSCKKEGQTRKGRQVYLGGYDMEEKAARAYDQAALKYWGPSTHINFPVENYEQELEEMRNMSRQEYVAHLRRRSSGFSRGASIYRGVTRHHQHGRWQARIGRVAGNKDLYLGTFSTQEDAAEAYDVAAIKFRGTNAVTNFDVSRYNVEKIIESNSLLAGELARRTKDVDPESQDRLQNGEPKTISDEAEPIGDGLEESPKRNNSLPMVLGMQQPLSNAWIPTATETTTTTQMRSHMPIFAAWTDA